MINAKFSKFLIINIIFLKIRLNSLMGSGNSKPNKSGVIKFKKNIDLNQIMVLSEQKMFKNIVHSNQWFFGKPFDNQTMANIKK